MGFAPWWSCFAFGRVCRIWRKGANHVYGARGRILHRFSRKALLSGPAAAGALSQTTLNLAVQNLFRRRLAGVKCLFSTCDFLGREFGGVGIVVFPIRRTNPDKIRLHCAARMIGCFQQCSGPSPKLPFARPDHLAARPHCPKGSR